MPHASLAMQELLTELRGLDDGALAAWAAGANRERLSLPFLGWLSDEELAASADEPDEQQVRQPHSCFADWRGTGRPL